MKVCIDAGHGGIDPGAVNGNLYEKVAALSIAKKAGAILEKAGVKVVYTRTTDIVSGELSLQERCNVANRAGVDYFISFHLNAATALSASGIETYAYSTSLPAYKLAQAVQKELVAATGARDRGTKTANFYVLRRTNMEAILIETGFISNDQEAKKLFDASYQNTIAQAVSNALLKFAGVKVTNSELEVGDTSKRYNYLKDIPEGEFRETIKKIMEKGIIKNADGKLNLTYDMIRMLVMQNRAGVYK